MVELKDIKVFSSDWKNALKDRLNGQAAELVIVQVGNVEASNRYVRNKLKDCDNVGIWGRLRQYPEDITQIELEKEIKNIVNNERPHGIIVQLPLPEHIDKDAIAQLIPPDMDVDGFRYDSWYKPCTPLGIMKYLEYCGFQFSGSNVVVIGRSDIVGKPMAKMLIDADATVTLCHSKTRNLYDFTMGADLIVCAVGKPKFLNCYPLHMPIIDVGINFNDEGKLCGDCFNTENRNVTPVPGGVGLLTRCALLENVVQSMEKRKKYEN